ncbi:MAG: recombination protein O N-terminal domain-containing protein [Lachnospiraceae bacterium]|nr:recombination protein O N-terminal domain-containing protein [Lachnospiraceae bacterium]
MESPVTCIALRTVKYSDKSSISTIWTREFGRMAVTTPSGSGREAQRRRAIMMPMCAFEAIADVRPGKEIGRLKDVRPIGAGQITNPAAAAIAMFLADFLYAALKDSGPDRALSDFLIEMSAELKKTKGNALANFHLSFMYRLSVFLGIEPDMGTYAPGRFFDMREARFVKTPPLHQHALDPDRAQALHALSRLRPKSLRLMKLNRLQRNEMLDRILEYYTLHYARLSNLPSLAVVRDLFS